MTFRPYHAQLHTRRIVAITHTLGMVLILCCVSCIPVDRERRNSAAQVDIIVPGNVGAIVRINARDLLKTRPGWPADDETNGLAVFYRNQFVHCEIVGGQDGRLDPGDTIEFRIDVRNRHSPQLTYQLVRHDPLTGSEGSPQDSICHTVPARTEPNYAAQQSIWHLAYGEPDFITGIVEPHIQHDNLVHASIHSTDEWRKIDTVVVAPAAWLPVFQHWVAHRERQGHRIALISAEDIYLMASSGNPSPEAIKQVIWKLHRYSKGTLRNVLLVGDVRSQYEPGIDVGTRVPTFYRRKVHYPGYTTQHEYPSDAPYARPPEQNSNTQKLAVGRIPASTPVELKAMLDKILRYEQGGARGEWKRRLVLFGGPSNYGGIADKAVESHAQHLLNTVLPYSWDVRFVFAKASSPYAYRLDALGQKLASELSNGALIAAYFGHGGSDSFDWVGWRGEAWSIGNAEELRAISTADKGAVFFSFTCDNGAFDRPEGHASLAEVMALDPDGPIATFASSRASHPYPNALYAGALIDTFLKGRPKTLGAGLLRMRQQVQSNRLPLAELLVKTSIQSLVMEHLELYNLLGDPLTRLQYPEVAKLLVIPRDRTNIGDGLFAPGEALLVETTVPLVEGELLVTLETDRRTIGHVLVPYEELVAKPLDEAFSAMARNHSLAIDKVVTRRTIQISKMKNTMVLQAPNVPGTYYIKMFAQGTSRSMIASEKITVVQR